MKTYALNLFPIVLGFLSAIAYGETQEMAIASADHSVKGIAIVDSASSTLKRAPLKAAISDLFNFDSNLESDSFNAKGELVDSEITGAVFSDQSNHPTLSKVGVSRKSNVFILRPNFPGKTGADLEVKNVFGKKVMSGRWRSRAFRLDLSRHPKGIYFLHLSGAQNSKAMVRIHVK